MATAASVHCPASCSTSSTFCMFYNVVWTPTPPSPTPPTPSPGGSEPATGLWVWSGLRMDQVQEPLQTSGPIENSGRRDGSGPETRSGPPRPPPRADMEFRIKELHNRHFLLLKMQRFRKKVEENGTAEGSESGNRSQINYTHLNVFLFGRPIVVNKKWKKKKTWFMLYLHQSARIITYSVLFFYLVFISFIWRSNIFLQFF